MATATTRKRRRPVPAGKGAYRVIKSPMGTFALLRHADGELSMTWLNGKGESKLQTMQRDDRMLPDVVGRLRDYFKGQAVEFSDVPTPRGGKFFVRCWEACRRIPRGRTVSYAQLATMAGGTSAASRAAGQAMRRNPLPIIVPCHRVVASNGALHGFAGSTDPCSGPLHLKEALLKLEQAR